MSDTRTADGGALFADHLAKSREIVSRGYDLLKSRETELFRSPELEVVFIPWSRTLKVSIPKGHQIMLVASDQWETLKFVNKSLLDETLATLRKEQVLEDLGDL